MTKRELKLAAPETEFSFDFAQGMADRMAVSFHKYGKVADAVPWKIDALGSAHKRIQKYLDTKNTEWLVDAANFIMMEFMHPSLEGAHFRPTDSNESPGRLTTMGDGECSKANSEIE